MLFWSLSTRNEFGNAVDTGQINSEQDADALKRLFDTNFHFLSNAQLAQLLPLDDETRATWELLEQSPVMSAYTDPYGQKIPGVEAKYVERSPFIDVAMFAASLVTTGPVAGALLGLEMLDMFSRDEPDPLDIGLTLAGTGPLRGFFRRILGNIPVSTRVKKWFGLPLPPDIALPEPHRFKNHLFAPKHNWHLTGLSDSENVDLMIRIASDKSNLVSRIRVKNGGYRIAYEYDIVDIYGNTQTVEVRLYENANGELSLANGWIKI